MNDLHDEDLRGLLREHYLRTDPAPERVHHAARGAFAWRDVENELAELAADSLLVDAPVRSRTGPRLLSFACGPVAIEMEVNETGRTRQVVGQVLPPTAGELQVRGPQHGVRPDELGRFFLDDLPAGPFSLTWRPSEGPCCNTAWIDI